VAFLTFLVILGLAAILTIAGILVHNYWTED
jgi:hypothetical protein